MRTLPALALVVAAALLPAAARAAPDPPPVDAARTFREAEVAERSLGKLERAAELYLEAAAAADDAADRARAELRAASCLRRAGRPGDARVIVERWAALPVDEVPEGLRAVVRSERAALGGGSPDAGGNPAAGTAEPRSELTGKLAASQREKEELEKRVDELVEEEQRSLEKLVELIATLGKRDREIDALRAQQPQEPETAEEVLRMRRREQVEDARKRVRWARLLLEEGRFAEARDLAYEALERDPDNVAARALLARVSAPLGDRERLYQEIVGVVALSREVRLARVAAEVTSLVEEGRRRQGRGDHQGSTTPLVRALALLDTGTVALRKPNALRKEIEGMLTAAESAGATRPPPPTIELAPWEERWSTALRELLSRAGTEIARGLDLVFHDLDPLLGHAGAGLPPRPVGAPPAGWTLSGETVPGGDLVVAYLRATEPAAFRTPGASLELIGSSAVAVAASEAQRRMSATLTHAAAADGPAATVRVQALRAAADDWPALLSRSGIAAETLAGGGRAARLPPQVVRALRTQVATRSDAVMGDARFQPTPLRGFRLRAGTVLSPLTVDVLAVGGDQPGVGLGVHVAWRAKGRADDAALEQHAIAGAPLEPGAALLVFGLADPQSPERDLAVLVQMGNAPAPTPDAGAGAPEAPPRPLPPGAAGMRSAAHLLPRWLSRLHELGSLPLHSPGMPLPGRRDALLRRLERAARGAVLLELEEDRVLVVGPESAHDGVHAFLAQFERQRAPQVFEVTAHQLSYAHQERLRRLVPTLSPIRSGAFQWGLVRSPATLRQVRLQLEAARGELALISPRASAPVTGHAEVAEVMRSSYRRDLDLAAGGELSWGRSETAWVDLGLLLSFRPFGRTTTNRIDFDVSVRTALLVDRGAKGRTTALGPVAYLEPEVRASGGDLSLALAEDEVLLLTALANPFPAQAERESLVLVVRALK